MTDKQKTEEETFLKRWSRRKSTEEDNPKAKNSADAILEKELSTKEKLEKTEAQEAEEKEMAENREAAEAIDLETLTYDSDFAPFMKKGVPEVLKNLAMRKLWTSNPILANVDGLNDYDENFADPALNVFKSDWKVGRGFLTDEDDEEERLRKLAEKEEQEKEDEIASTSNEEITKEESDQTSSEEEVDHNLMANELDEKQLDSHNNLANNDVTASETQMTLHEEVKEETPTIKRVSLRSRLLEDE